MGKTGMIDIGDDFARKVLRDDVDRAVGQLVEVQGLLVTENAPRCALVEHLLELGVRDRRDEHRTTEAARPEAGGSSAACSSGEPQPMTARP